MFDLTLTTSLTSPLAIGAPGLAPAAGDFALALADLVLPGADSSTATPALPTARQPLAETGNALPVAAAPTALADDWLTLTPSDDAQASSPDSVPMPRKSNEGSSAADAAAPDAALVALLEASGDAAPTADHPAAKLHDEGKKKPDAASAPATADTPTIDASAMLLAAGNPAPSQPMPTPLPTAGDADLAAVAPRASDPSIALPVPMQQPTSTSTDTDAVADLVAKAPPVPAGGAVAAASPAAVAPSDSKVQPSPARLPTATLAVPPEGAQVSRPEPSTTPADAAGQPSAGDTKTPVQPAVTVAPALATDTVQIRSTPALDRAIEIDAPSPQQQQPAKTAPVATLQAQSAAAPAQAAGMVFGFALSAGLLPSQRADATEPSPREIALQALSAAAGSTQIAGAVVAAGHAQQSSLDMRRDDWPQTMIDHIEALRDAADATSTRITLIPDALGKVDVSIKHDGDAVNVHFAADVPQTRTMLADAQPKLAEAALVRGVRLGQATVDTGGGEAGRQPPQQHNSTNASRPPRPVSVPLTEADAAAPDSTRLA